MCENNSSNDSVSERLSTDANLDQKSSDAACPLSAAQQRRNLLRYAAHVSLLYLAAPVVYVGNLDAILLNKFGYSDKVANLPASAFLWTTAPFLVFFTWYFCRVQVLKPILVIAYSTVAFSGLIVVIALLQTEPTWLVIALIMRSTLMGWCLGIINFFEWEILARGVAERRRGLALSLAFGLGPMLAVISSCGTQLLLDGRLGPIEIQPLSFPWDFVSVFAASVLITFIPAISAMCYIVPLPSSEVERTPFIQGVFGGLQDFLRNRTLVMSSVAFLLMIFASNSILPSVVLYTKDVLGEDPQRYAGYQLALRFSFKIVAGLLLGWLLTRTYPRAGLTATMSFSLVGLFWAFLVPGKWYLVAFGLLGAGELYHVYNQNYIVSASATASIRRNLAYANLLALPASFAPLIFGAISDCFGLRQSIVVAAVLLTCSLLFVQLVLPRRPNIAT